MGKEELDHCDFGEDVVFGMTKDIDGFRLDREVPTTNAFLALPVSKVTLAVMPFLGRSSPYA
ncbi:MAG: hypothetical protein H6923_03535 [Alphaproteobacteria bacterium]|nr:hypothetical protein [Alphaproteobacteria bacterium]